MTTTTTRDQRIADREQQAKLALQARYDEIETLRNRTPVKAVRTGGRNAKLASMLEFIEAFEGDVDMTDDDDAQAHRTARSDDELAPSHHFPSVDSFANPIVHVSPKSRECRAKRLQAISARIMRVEAKKHSRACYGDVRAHASAMILSRRGVKICEAIIRAENRASSDVMLGDEDSRYEVAYGKIVRIKGKRKLAPLSFA